MDFYTRKLAYLWLRLSEFIINIIVYFYSIFYKKSNRNGEIKSIGAYWYGPIDLTGSDLRLGEWKVYFEKDGISYTNLHVNSFKEFSPIRSKGTWTQKYLYFAKSLWRRLPQMLIAHRFDTIWIDRALIPFYPRKSSFLENRLKLVVKRVVVDCTDGGDYQDNPQLMDGVFKSADKITVGYKFLKQMFSERFDVTQVFWTIPTEKYTIKRDYNFKNKPVIGWMGSPGNFYHIRKIIPILEEVNKEFPFVFEYICRENLNHEFKDIEVIHHFFSEDYHTVLSNFDIGLSPNLENDLRAKGKIAMKHQEFLLMGTPQICSPIAISEFVVNEEHVLIANEIEDWKKYLIQLLTNESLREKLGSNCREVFNENYLYSSQYEKLKKVLVD